MIEALCFTLAAPMASFGEVAGNTSRGTRERPGHSLVVGLLGAALGLDRADARLLAMSDGLRVSVAMARPGPLLRDYHTVQSVEKRRGFRPATRREALLEGKTATAVTERDYLTDCRAEIAVQRVEGPIVLEEMRQALERPRFTLYLGRKSCPLALPLTPVIVAADRLDEALAAYRREHARRLDEFWGLPAQGLEISLDARLAGPADSGRRQARRAAPEDPRAWRYRLLEELTLASPAGDPPA